MNRLQNIDPAKHGQIFVTMNPLFEPDADKMVEEYSYTHPLYNQEVGFAHGDVCRDPTTTTTTTTMMMTAPGQPSAVGADAIPRPP